MDFFDHLTNKTTPFLSASFHFFTTLVISIWIPLRLSLILHPSDTVETPKMRSILMSMMRRKKINTWVFLSQQCPRPHRILHHQHDHHSSISIIPHHMLCWSSTRPAAASILAARTTATTRSPPPPQDHHHCNNKIVAILHHADVVVMMLFALLNHQLH